MDPDSKTLAGWWTKYSYQTKTGRPRNLVGTKKELERRWKHAVRKRVHYAVKTGRLVKPDLCEYAFCLNKTQTSHHPDYNEPYTVVWLCWKHHRELHKSLGVRYGRKRNKNRPLNIFSPKK